MAASNGFAWFCTVLFLLRLDNALDLSKLLDMESSPEKFRKQIIEAWAELHMAESAQRKLEQRIQDLRDLIRATANFLPNNERMLELMILDMCKHPSNITEAVRLVLFINMATDRNKHITPVEIRDMAEARGFNFTDYSNPLASIHTILRRMKESDPPEVIYDEESGGYTPTRHAMGSVVSPLFAEKLQAATSKRIVEKVLATPTDPEKIRALMKQIADEVLDEELDKTKREEAVKAKG
jgi:hypothetical protein